MSIGSLLIRAAASAFSHTSALRRFAAAEDRQGRQLVDRRGVGLCGGDYGGIGQDPARGDVAATGDLITDRPHLRTATNPALVLTLWMPMSAATGLSWWDWA